MKVKVLWKRKSCGCVSSYVESAGPVAIRCERHRRKAAKKGRTLCYFDPSGIVRREHGSL